MDKEERYFLIEFRFVVKYNKLINSLSSNSYSVAEILNQIITRFVALLNKFGLFVLVKHNLRVVQIAIYYKFENKDLYRTLWNYRYYC